MITAALLVAIVLFCVLVLPSWLSAVLFGVAWTLGAWEWGRFVEWSRGFVWAYTAVFVLLALASGGFFDAAGAQQVALAAASWWLLAFIGVKMILTHHWPIPTPISLAVIAGILGIGIVASFAPAKLETPSWLAIML